MSDYKLLIIPTNNVCQGEKVFLLKIIPTIKASLIQSIKQEQKQRQDTLTPVLGISTVPSAPDSTLIFNFDVEKENRKIAAHFGAASKFFDFLWEGRKIVIVSEFNRQSSSNFWLSSDGITMQSEYFDRLQHDLFSLTHIDSYYCPSWESEDLLLRTHNNEWMEIV